MAEAPFGNSQVPIPTTSVEARIYYTHCTRGNIVVYGVQ